MKQKREHSDYELAEERYRAGFRALTKNHVNYPSEKNSIDVNWGLYEKIVDEKYKRGILNFPTDKVERKNGDAISSIPLNKVKEGDCIMLCAREYKMVFNVNNTLRVLGGFRGNDAVPLQTQYGGHKHISRVIFTALQKTLAVVRHTHIPKVIIHKTSINPDVANLEELLKMKLTEYENSKTDTINKLKEYSALKNGTSVTA